MLMSWVAIVALNTVKSIYNESAYKELLDIKNWFSFPNHRQGKSSLNVYKKLRLKGTDFHDLSEFLLSGFYCRSLKHWFWHCRPCTTLSLSWRRTRSRAAARWPRQPGWSGYSRYSRSMSTSVMNSSGRSDPFSPSAGTVTAYSWVQDSFTLLIFKLTHWQPICFNI